MEKPDASVLEPAWPYGCLVVAVCKALKKHSVTCKKSPCGINHDLCREKGRVLRGVNIHNSRRRGKTFGRTHVVAALNGTNIIAPRWYTGTAMSLVFED